MSNVLVATSVCLNLLTLALVIGLVLKPSKPIKESISTKSISVIPFEKLYSGSVPVTVIANYGGRPWGNESAFIDLTAKWLWGMPNDYPTWLFFTTFKNESVHFISDQYGYLYIDGVAILESKERGWTTSDYAQTTVKLTPGEHIVAIYAENTIGTGGILAALVQRDGATLVKTDEKWSCKKIKKN